MKAVVVDDSRIVRERVTEMLLDLTRIEDIAQAVDGQNAMEVITQVKPDLVVLDIHMPRADGKRADNGMDVLKLIKAGANPPIVIMLSNFGEPQYRARCKQLGADAFLDKSNEVFQLVAIAAALLNLRRESLA